MTVGRVCSCGTVTFPGDGHLCVAIAARTATDNRRRALKARAQGLNRAHFRKLREQAFNRDGGICCTVIATTVHLRPELRGDHDSATLADVVSSCAHCHGVVDAPRAASAKQPSRSAVGHPRGRRSPANASAYPAPRPMSISASRSEQDSDRSTPITQPNDEQHS